MTTDRAVRRRSPALAARILVASLAIASMGGLVGWMGRSARLAGAVGEVAEAPRTVRRVVVVPTPEPEPDIVLQAVLAGRTVTVVTTPPRIIRRAPAASAGAAGTPVSSSRGS